MLPLATASVRFSVSSWTTAMTMTLTWKVKEFILHSVFSGR